MKHCPHQTRLSGLAALALFSACGNARPAEITQTSGQVGCTTPERSGFRVVEVKTPRANSVAAAGDFNEDGLPDLISDGAMNGIGVFLSDASGKLSGPVQNALGCASDGSGDPDCGTAWWLSSKPYSLQVGDVDEDGHLDVVAVLAAQLDETAAPTRLQILRGRGDGTFVEASAVQTQPYVKWAAMRDWNADGHLDIVVSAEDTVECRANALVHSDNAPACHPFEVHPDCADGLACRAIDHQEGGKCLPALCPNLTIYTGDGRGAFSPIKTIETQDTHSPITMADVDGNGRVDIVAAGFGIVSSTGKIYLNDGPSSIRALPLELFGKVLSGLHVADLNADGREDVVSGDAAFLGAVDGSVEKHPHAAASHLDVYDMDADGRLDMVASHPYFTAVEDGNKTTLGDGDTLDIWLGDAAGNFKPDVSLCLGPTPFVLAADFNHDGYGDIAASVSPEWKSITILYGTKAGRTAGETH
jgi:hypothetical protein